MMAFFEDNQYEKKSASDTPFSWLQLAFWPHRVRRQQGRRA
jgi:hypothetical protein